MNANDTPIKHAANSAWIPDCRVIVQVTLGVCSGKYAITVAPTIFGLIEGFIRCMAKRLGRFHGGIVLRNPHAEAYFQVDSIVVKHLIPHAGHKCFDETFSLGGIRAMQNNAEFIAPEPRGLIGLAGMQAQYGADIP
jgi:hypothetical protein